MRFIFLILCLIFSSHAFAQMKIVATYPPIQSLVSAVTDGVYPVSALHLAPEDSHHGIELKPSQMKTLSKADVVFWVGESLESYMPQALQKVAPLALSVPLIQTPDLHIIKDKDGIEDTHIWMDVDNARLMIKKILAVLIDKDPKNKAAFEKNAQRAQEELDKLDILKGQTGEYSFLALHSGYPYFFDYFDVKGESLLFSHTDLSKPKTVQNLRSKIKEANAACLVVEPTISRKDLKLLQIEKSPRQKIELMGWHGSAGPALYTQMMRWNMDLLKACVRIK